MLLARNCKLIELWLTFDYWSFSVPEAPNISASVFTWEILHKVHCVSCCCRSFFILTKEMHHYWRLWSAFDFKSRGWWCIRAHWWGKGVLLLLWWEVFLLFPWITLVYSIPHQMSSIAAFCFIFSVLEDYHNRETTSFGNSFGSDSNDQLRVGEFSIFTYLCIFCGLHNR